MILENDNAIAAHERVTTQCANCYHVGPCIDDGEAFVCADRDACKARCISYLFRLAPVPGTELMEETQVLCAACGATHPTQACLFIRARLMRTSTPRYYFSDGDILDEYRPLRDTDITDRMNEQDDDIDRLRAELKEARNLMGALLAYMPERSNPYLTRAADAARAWLGAK